MTSNLTASENESRPPTQVSPAYMPQLDGLRAFAVIAVAFHHWFPHEYHLGFRWGPAGVQLFFVLSGFLITGIALRCRDYSDLMYATKAFYARRFLRIFPLYYCVLLALYIYGLGNIRNSIGWHAAYLSNIYFFWRGRWEGSLSHFWTLSVEEQFYLFWPAIILFVPQRWVGRSVVVLIAVGVVSRLGLPLLFPETPLLHVLPNTNFDSLGMGALLACIASGAITSFNFKALLWGLPAFVSLFTLERFGIELPLHEQLEQLSLLLLSVWLVERASRGFTGVAKTVLENPVAMYLGRISYGLYVLHNFAYLPVDILARRLHLPLLEHPAVRISLMIIFTLCGASLSWKLLEQPLNSLKARFPYSRKTPGDTVKSKEVT